MKLNERGVLDTSDIYVYNSSLIRKDYFHQMLCVGHYFCTHEYSVKPNTLDSFLILFVVSGSLYITDNRAGHAVLKEGQMAMLNCYERPSYGTTDKVEFYWIHFDSHDTDQIYAAMRQTVITVADKKAMESNFKHLIRPFLEGGQPSEALVNKYITYMFTEFFEPTTDGISGLPRSKFDTVCDYINSHLDSRISNDELAAMANMSPYHFIRAFKKEVGFTPHDFILRSRVNTAVFLLRATSLSLSEITYRCGFSSESAFSNSFKAITGTTPLKCRQEAWGKGTPRSKIASMEHIEKTTEE